MRSESALYKLLDMIPEKQHVLDIGCGRSQIHTSVFAERGHFVSALDIAPGQGSQNVKTYQGYFEELKHNFKEIDVVWCAHVLEHQLNVQIFLKSIYNILKEGGYLAITVPPHKDEIVGGHVTLWNAGLLLYNLVLAGFNCRQASVLKYDYDISVIVQKTPAFIGKLSYDSGDLVVLRQYFPEGLVWKSHDCFQGNIRRINWYE